MKTKIQQKTTKITKYREAKKGDWKNIKLIISLYPETLMQSNLPKWDKFFVAENNKKIVGCCALDIYSRRIAEIRSLAVLLNYQRKGIGTNLIKLCLNKAKKKKILEIITITGKESLFKKFGFNTFNNEKMALLKILKTNKNKLQ